MEEGAEEETGDMRRIYLLSAYAWTIDSLFGCGM